jgi:hypothetical protein
MKLNLRFLLVLPCLAAFIAMTGTAHAVTVSGTVWSGWSGSVPLAGGLPAAGTASATFTSSAIDFCSDSSVCTPPGSGAYTLAGFLGSNGGASGVSGISYMNGATGISTLDNTLWEFTGTALFTNGQTYNVGHDDGAILYIGGTSAGNIFLNQPGPTSFVSTPYVYTGATGLQSFTFLYGETSGAPAVFETNLVGSTVPEPSSIILLGSGLLGVAGLVRRRLSL